MKPQTEHFKWVAEISIDKVWIEDGFNLTEAVLHDALTKVLPYAYKDEVRVHIKKAPPGVPMQGLKKYCK